MEGFKDENYSWYKAAGLVLAVYIMLVFAEIMTGKGTSVFWFSAALGPEKENHIGNKVRIGLCTRLP